MANGYTVIKDFINQNRNTNIPDGYTDKELITFRPVECLQSDLTNITPIKGCVYFTTDTKRIYIVKDGAFISMGGNSGIYYARQSWDTGATSPFRFDYGSLDINQDVDVSEYTIPLENDLIFNYVDRSFYRVLGEAIDTDGITYLQAERLAVSGSGGGGGEEPGGGSGSLSIVTDPSDLSQRFYVRKGDAYKIRFLPKATDEDGSITGDGTGVLTITLTGQKINLPVVSNGVWNEIDITSYLQDGRTDIKLQVYMDIGGGITKQGTKTWKLNVFTSELTWDLDESEIYSGSTVPISWSSTGYVNKKAYIKIDDNYIIEDIPETDSLLVQTYNIDREQYNLVHGVHKITMWIEVNLGKETVKTNEISHNIITIDADNKNPIISIGYYKNNIKQYDTIEIPIIIYDPTKAKEALTNIKILEDLKELNIWNDYINGSKQIYTYIPTEPGLKNFIVAYKGAEAAINFNIESLDLTIKEVEGYAFKFKPGELGSNTGIQQWNSNGVNFEFSENFDWINGGLRTEKDENGDIKSYFLIKAGNTATINYQPFSNNKNLNNNGFCFKIIYKATQCRDFNAKVLSCIDENTDNKIGLLMNAQDAIYNTEKASLKVPYCENTYMEFEVDTYSNSSGKGRYCVSWLDGIPSGAIMYNSSEDTMVQNNPQKIIIGSSECDVQVYLIKHYTKHLTDEEHLNNFITDAPNPTEMMNRFRRNDILGGNGDISYEKLIAACPNLPIHVYDVSRMTTGKGDGDETNGCIYNQYLGSNTPHIHAENVIIKAQGTSSIEYILAAANIDSNFKKCSVLTKDGENINPKIGWSMDEEALPINYWNTKVNVASCEGANNAIFQEWYNRFQPYKSIARRKWEKKNIVQKMRDTMQFQPGIMFVIDRNKNIDKNQVERRVDLNVFADTPGYADNPYAKLYAICNMGNSKKNYNVFHDMENLNECCIEVADNQEPYQRMVNIPDESQWDYIMDDHGFDIRYSYETKVQKIDKPPKRYCDAWKRLVSWMMKSDPCSMWREAGHGNKLTQNEFNELHKDKIIYYYDGLDRKFILPIDNETVWNKDTIYYTGLISETRFNNYKANKDNLYTLLLDDEHDWVYQPVNYNTMTYNNNTQYYLMTEHVNGYTGKKLPEERTFSPYTFKPGNYGDGDSRILDGIVESAYAGTYDTDCYKYRMAKMLEECEEYLIMDSFVYHYLMIERHSLVDNVAKNTFWTCENVGAEDSNHEGELWQIVKDYDNDTAAGTDNEGKLSMHYGYECLDLKDNTSVNYDVRDFPEDVFNAKASVWLNFISGLTNACDGMRNSSKLSGAWDTQALLNEFSKWQDQIPERCWIEDYYRKYFRPNEFFGETKYLEKLAGGKKTHQRKRFETYQGYYIDSKYVKSNINANNIALRANGSWSSPLEIPLRVYSDCYIQCAAGSGNIPNVSKKVKAGTDTSIFIPPKVANDMTFYLYPASLIQKIGDIRDGKVLGLGSLAPKSLTMNSATRLRECYLDYIDVSDGGTTTFNSQLLEKLVFINNRKENSMSLNLAGGESDGTIIVGATGLKYLDTTGSYFSSISLPNYAPINYLHLGSVGGLTMSNLLKIEDFMLDDASYFTSLNLSNIDQSKALNSKNDIIDKIIAANKTPRYKLNDVKWTLGVNDNINTPNIEFLETIYNNWNPNESAGATALNKLTGILIVPEEKYNGEESLAIYSRYKELFPGLDINFQSDTSKLYKVNIYDSSHSVIAWSSKTNKTQIPNQEFYTNNGLTENFLKTQNIITKTATPAKTYTFTGTWQIQNNAGVVIDTIKSATYPIFAYAIQSDVNCYPIFKEADRLYTISFYNENGALINKIEAKYGTKLSDSISLFEASHTPTKDDSQLGAYNTYVFKGYSLNQGSIALVNGNSSLVRNISLYYVFNEVDVRTFDFSDYFEKVVYNSATDARNYLYTEYFGKNRSMWNGSTYSESMFVNGKTEEESGILIIPKGTLPNKICIPTIYTPTKETVIGIANGKRKLSQDTDTPANNPFYNVSYVFFNDDSKCRFIYTDTFNNCYNLKVITLPNSLRIIGDRAFRYCRIDLNLKDGDSYLFNFPSNLLYIGTYGFIDSFAQTAGSRVLAMPASLSSIGCLGFANFTTLSANKIELWIGNENNPSQLELDTTQLIANGSFYSVENVDNRKKQGCIVNSSSLPISKIVIYGTFKEDILKQYIQNIQEISIVST